MGWTDLDGCALSVQVTVVSRPTPTRAIIDGGSKTFSNDPAVHASSYGAVRGHSEYTLTKLTEEHGIMTVPSAAHLPIGTGRQVIPNTTRACLHLDGLVAAVGSRPAKQ